MRRRAEFPDILLRGGRPGFQPHPGAQLLAVLPVRHSEYGDVLDLFKSIQEFLDFPRVDVLAAAVLRGRFEFPVQAKAQHRAV